MWLVYLSRKLKEFHSEESSAEFIAKEFKKFGLERVKIEEHSIVVTYPDPARPNRLEVLDDKNSTVYNITNVENRDEAKRSKQNEEELTPLMPSISSGAVEVIICVPRFDKTYLQGYQQSETPTSLLSYRL